MNVMNIYHHSIFPMKWQSRTLIFMPLHSILWELGIADMPSLKDSDFRFGCFHKARQWPIISPGSIISGYKQNDDRRLDDGPKSPTLAGDH